MILNFVDLERFQPRPPLPARPVRALVFSNAASEETYLPAAREACVRAGITLDVMGLASGRPCAAPGKVLGRYDLVFAKGKAALEAAAVGCAVILCDVAGAGPLVTAVDLDRLRELNFGQRVMRNPLEGDVLYREILRYDSGDAAEVSRRVRATAGRDPVIDALLDLYRSVIEEQVRSGPQEAAAEGRALAAYLRWLSPRAKGTERATAEVEEMRRALNAERAAQAALRGTITFRLRERLLRVPDIPCAVRWLAKMARPRASRS